MIRWRDLNSLDDLLSASASASVAELERTPNERASHQTPSRREAPPAREPAPSFPRLSLFECEAGFELLAPLPGVSAETVDLQIERDLLTIRGERRLADPEGQKCLRRERRRGAFLREIVLPVSVDAEKIEAQMRDGILRVLLPKAPTAKARKIEVRTS